MAQPFSAVNYDAIGKGFVGLLDDSEKAALTIGMIPQGKWDILVDQLWETIARKYPQNDAWLFYGLPIDVVKNIFKPENKRATEHALSVAILKHGHLIV